MNETKSWFFEKINKINKPLARLVKGKREPKSIKSEIKSYHWHHNNIRGLKRLQTNTNTNKYANKMDNLEEMDKFLEMNTIPRLYQEEIRNTNRSITSIEVEKVI